MTNTTTEMKNERLIIAMLACINFTHIMDFVIMMPLGPQFQRVFHINTREFSMIVSSYTFSASLSGIFSALFIDRFDRKISLLLLYAGFIVGTYLCALAPTYQLLIGARIIAGAFGGVVAGQVLAIVGDVVPPERRGKAMGMIMAAFSVASVVGVPIGLYFATKLSWHAPFLALASMGAAVLICAYYLLPPLRNHLKGGRVHNPIGDLQAVISDKNHVRALLLSMVLMMAGFSVIPFISPYMVSNVGLKEEELPFIYLAGGIFTFVTSQWIGRLADKFGKHRTFFVVALLSTLPILAITNLPKMELPYVLVVTTVFMILVSGRFVPAMALITSSTTPSHRGSFMSVNSSVQQMAAGVAAFLAGLVIEQNESSPMEHYHLVGFIAVGATLMCLWLANRIQTRT